MRLRQSATVAFVSALLLAGCGGDASSPGGESGLSDADIAEIGKVSETVKVAAAEGNGKVICQAAEPSLVKKSFPTEAACIKGAEKAIRGGAFKKLEIEKITGSSSEATVTYKSGKPDTLTFVKADGNWYIGQPGSSGPAASSE